MRSFTALSHERLTSFHERASFHDERTRCRTRRAIARSREFAARLRKECVAEDGNDWRDEAVLLPGYDDQALRKTLNELKTKLRLAGPDPAALIRLLPEKGRFTLDLPAESIALA